MRRAGAFALLLVTACAAFGGCSLGLDEGLIVDTSKDATSPSDATAGADADALADAASGDGSGGQADAGACTKDEQCTSTNGCLTGRCDLTRHACVFDVCPTAACHAASCDVSSHTCSVPTAYGFHSTSIHVTLGGVGCGGVAARCVAASYPFLFVGTANGVVAYTVSDPSNPSPASIDVTGLPFLPAAIVANGPRVYFVGNVVGSGPSYKLPLAWLDVPSDPTVSSLAAHTVLDTFGQSTVTQAFPGPNGSLFLEYAESSKFFPVAIASAPLQDLDTLKLFPSPGIPSGGAPVAASGARLVTYRWSNDNGVYNASFGLEDLAGTSGAQNKGEASLFAALGPTLPQPSFGQGADGSLVFAAPSTVVTDAGDSVIRSMRLAWVLADATTVKFDGSAHVDVETYQPPLNSNATVTGPVVWIDASTALALAAASGTQGQTSVQVATKLPSPSLVAGRRYVLPVNVNAVGAASSNGFGYVLAADAPDSATVHVFAPACSL